MNSNNFIDRIKQKIHRTFIHIIFQYPRILKYKLLSNCKKVIGKPIYNQPVQLLGNGSIVFGNNVNLGVTPSPFFYTGYIYIDARKINSYINIGNDTWINNNATIISDGAKIFIGNKCLIGYNLEIIDSDFHELSPDKRFGGKNIIKKDTTINDNVFIGNNVTILKGVVIGKNSVIGNRSTVTKSIPADVIVGGNPARIIKHL